MVNSKSRVKIILCVGILFLALTAVFGIYLFKTPALNIQEEKSIIITDHDNLETLTARLISEHGLKYPWVFKTIARRMNTEKFMKKGRYHLRPNMNFVELARLIREGKMKTVDLVIRPQMDLNGFAKRCGYKLEADVEDYLNIVKNEAYLKTLGFDTATVYALILPDKYNVYWHTEADELMQRMKKEYDLFWNGERMQKLQRTGLTQIEVSILASIVSKETNMLKEMPDVAGMYINRLRIDMPLQADPTIKFALNQPDLRRILKGHLNVVSPYNTYTNKGLPPGPICIPGKQAIDAVLSYTEHNYLFMCAKEDFSGYHNFAENYDQHLKNASKYQKALDARGIH